MRFWAYALASVTKEKIMDMSVEDIRYKKVEVDTGLVFMFWSLLRLQELR